MCYLRVKRGDLIQKKILDVLARSENPMSTRDIGLKIDRAWHSVQGHCLRLQLAGKIHGFRVGNMNLWVIKR
ncbi:hypothetical protein KY345_05595 [Candidatus Woesearchaeota archaeon]|nr:hypothetical protein [Candidatus Woesearchaeota archaeon]